MENKKINVGDIFKDVCITSKGEGGLNKININVVPFSIVLNVGEIITLVEIVLIEEEGKDSLKIKEMKENKNDGYYYLGEKFSNKTIIFTHFIQVPKEERHLLNEKNLVTSITEGNVLEEIEKRYKTIMNLPI